MIDRSLGDDDRKPRMRMSSSHQIGMGVKWVIDRNRNRFRFGSEGSMDDDLSHDEGHHRSLDGTEDRSSSSSSSSAVYSLSRSGSSSPEPTTRLDHRCFLLVGGMIDGVVSVGVARAS